MIEQDLKRIADALEVIAKSLPGQPAEVVAAPDPTTKKPRAPKPAPAAAATTEDPFAPPAAPAVSAKTADDVLDKLREVVQAKGTPAGKEVLAKFNATKVSEVKPEDFDKIYAHMETLLKK